MVTKIVLRDGRVFTYPETQIQQKDSGQTIAVYESETYRIIAEFDAAEVERYEAIKEKSAAA
jgi:hypothetical protein